MNQVALIGRLVRDPELAYMQNGKAYAKFTLAVDPPFKGQNGEKLDAYFIPCVVWDKKAEALAQYFCKGKPIAVSGSLTTQKYVTGEGQPKTSWEVNCQNFSFIPTDKTGQNGGANGSGNGGSAGPPVDDSLNAASGSDEFDPFGDPPIADRQKKAAAPPAEEIDPEDLYR